MNWTISKQKIIIRIWSFVCEAALQFEFKGTSPSCYYNSNSKFCFQIFVWIWSFIRIHVKIEVRNEASNSNRKLKTKLQSQVQIKSWKQVTENWYLKSIINPWKKKVKSFSKLICSQFKDYCFAWSVFACIQTEFTL